VARDAVLEAGELEVKPQQLEPDPGHRMTLRLRRGRRVGERGRD